MTEGQLTIEIGPSSDTPIVQMLRPDLRPGKPLFIDNNPNVTRKLQEAIRGSVTMPEDIREAGIIQGDITNLMLRNGSVDSIVLMNVFGQEGILEREENKGITGKRIHVGNLQTIAEELYRVCRPKGKIVVIETTTPLKKEGLIEKLGGAGFILDETYTVEQNNLSEIFSQSTDFNKILSNALISISDPEGYALVFQRPQEVTVKPPSSPPKIWQGRQR